MFGRASKPRAYLEEDHRRSDHELDCLPFAQPRSLRPAIPRSRIWPHLLARLPSQSSLWPRPSPKQPISGRLGLFARGGKGRFHLRFPQVPPRSLLGPSCPGVTFRMALVDPGTGPRVRCEPRSLCSLSLVLSLFYLRCGLCCNGGNATVMQHITLLGNAISRSAT